MNDRLLKASRLQPTDTTPVWFMRQAGRALPEYRAVRRRASLEAIVADPALCAEVTLQPVRRLGVDAAILFADITTPLRGIGLDVRIVDGVGPVLDAPVSTAPDVERLRAFEPDEAVGSLLAAIRLLRRELAVPLIGFAGAPFTLASYVVATRPSRDASAMKRLLREAPEVAGALLDRLADVSIAYLRAQVEAGVQVVQLFDSWVGALSPANYRRFVAAPTARVFAALAPLGVPAIHFGTGTAGLLEAMAAVGGDVIGVDWRIGLGDAWARLPNRAIQGNLDPEALLAPWPDARRQVAEILDEAGGRPGHIFNLGHGVLPATDPDRLRAVVDLVHERGVRQAAA